MEVSHALQILITGKYLAAPALKKAGVEIGSLTDLVLKLGVKLQVAGKLGSGAASKLVNLGVTSAALGRKLGTLSGALYKVGEEGSRLAVSFVKAGSKLLSTSKASGVAGLKLVKLGVILSGLSPKAIRLASVLAKLQQKLVILSGTATVTGIGLAGIGKIASRVTGFLSGLGKVGLTALKAGLAVPAAITAAAFKALWAVIKLVASALLMAVKAAAALTLGVAAITSALTAGIAAATKYAAGLENMYRAMWGIAGEATPALLASLREASAFMVTEKGLIKSYNMAYMLLGKTLSERLPEAYQYLTKVAAATGDDVEWLMERLTRSVGRLSTRWMAYIGTVVSVEEATARASEMFGKKAEMLTYAEKQAGMLDRVLAKLEARTSAMPDVLGTVTQLWEQLKVIFKDLWGDLGRHFLPTARSLLTVLVQLGQAIARLVSEGGALYGPIRKIAAAFSVLFDILGVVLTKFLGVEEEVTNRFETFADNLISLAWRAIEWGANIVVNLAIGLIKGASQALTGAMNFIAGLLAHWLAPGSAPLIASNILDWGAAAFTEYLRGFSMAQFDVLEGIQRPLKQALDVLVGLGEMGEIAGFEAFIGLSEGLAAALEEFGRTGQMSEDIFAQLAEVGGGYGESLAELLRRQLDLASAVEGLAAAEERLKRAREGEEVANKRLSKAAREYNKLVREGASPAVLKAKLAEVEASYDSLVAAREETDQAEDAREAAKEALKIKKEQVRLQQRLLAQLIALGQAMVNLRKAQQEEEEAYEIPPIEWPEFHPPPLDEAFEVLKETIRQKFEELWASLKQQWEESGVYESVMGLVAAWERLKEVLVPVWEWLQETWQGLKDWATDEAWPAILETWRGWKRWWETNGPEIKAKLVEIYDELKFWIVENLWKWVVEEWDKWVAWWEEDGPIIVEALQNLWSEFETLLGDLWNWTTGGKGWEGVWDKAYNLFMWFWTKSKIIASGSMEILRNTITFWSQIINKDWEGAWATAVEIGTIAWDTFHEVTNGKLLELSAAIFNFVSDPSGTIHHYGSLLVIAFLAGMVDIWSSVSTWFGSAITGLSSVISNPSMLLWDIGLSIMQGLANSILWFAYKIQDALSSVINAAVAAAFAALGMSSPSKVFYKIGENLMQGFIEGIDSLAKVPALSVSRAMTLTTSGATMGTGGRQVVIHNHFGRDSIRSDQDVYKLAEQIQRSMTLRGARVIT